MKIRLFMAMSCVVHLNVCAMQRFKQIEEKLIAWGKMLNSQVEFQGIPHIKTNTELKEAEQQKNEIITVPLFS